MRTSSAPAGMAAASVGERARAVLFLAGGDSSFVTRATLAVDGGMSV